MKAVVVTNLGEPDVLQMQDLPVPSPGPSQVLVHAVAASVNFADVKARRGEYHGAGAPPFVPGLDGAGVVEAVGPGVSTVGAGMRVAAFPYGGSYAEYFVADQALVFPIPDSLSWETAAALPTVGFMAFALLSRVAGLTAGESVLVHAAGGGVGTTAVQLAKALGAGTVIGVVGDAAKSDLVRELGADAVIVTTHGGFADQVLELTGGGVDVVLDSIGGSTTEESLTCLAHFGRLVHFGSASGQLGRIVVSDLHVTCRSVRGFSLGTMRRERPDAIAPLAAAVLAMASQGQFHMVISRHFPLERAAQSHQLIESRRSVGKIILDIC